MKYERSYPQFSACGLNCGLCPRYHTQGSSRCPGCAGKGFFEKHPSCGVLSCSRRHEVEYCWMCPEFPCSKYEGKDSFDSFISHKTMLIDAKRAKTEGLERYQEILNEKISLLEFLLENYNDGRRKNLYCIAVNLFDVSDLRTVISRLKTEDEKNQWGQREKTARAAELLSSLAEEKQLSLKLRPMKKK